MSIDIPKTVNNLTFEERKKETLKYLFYIILCVTVFSCKNKTSKSSDVLQNKGHNLELIHAKGFMLFSHDKYKILEINNPWPNAEKSYRYALIDENSIAYTTLNSDEFDGIITTPVKRIVVTSTTHIPALELLNVQNSLVGFPGCDYISSEKVRQQIDSGLVRELGENEGLNTEVLLELNPNIVIGFGVDGTSKSLNTIKNANIPVIYNGDWVEDSALAKAEWIKMFGALFNKEKVADSIFNHIEQAYVEAKLLASKVTTKPTVLSGAMHKDIWYLPSGTSAEAQLLKDANVNYLWQGTKGSGSLALNFETVFEKAKNADLWLSPSYYPSMEAIRKANEHYSKFSAFQSKNIYTFSNTIGKTGGVLYYELGMARPDLVLKDLIKICHPEVLEDYETYFFKKLE